VSSEDPPAFSLLNEISIIDQLSGTMFERVLPKGMTRAQFGILNHFVRLGHEARSPAQLASAFQVTRPTMTSTLDKLARRGLIAIRADPDDGRGKLVSLTPEGRAMREQCVAAAAQLTPLLGELASEAELKLMLPLLRRIRATLDAAR
jgi:DNA-binding MarR family transcriptional regulator